MEHPCPHNTRHSIHKERTQQHQLIKCNFFAVDENPVGQNTSNHQQDEIQQQNAPIWQCILAEIPIYQLLKRIFHEIAIILFILPAKVLHFSHLPKIIRQIYAPPK